MKNRTLLILLSLSLLFTAAAAQEQQIDRDHQISSYEEKWVDRFDTEPATEDFLELYSVRNNDPSGGDDRPMLTTGHHHPTHLFYAWMTGWQEIPPHRTMSRGAFMAQVADDYSGLHFRMYLWKVKNVVAAHIHLGKKGENGPAVATLYGPMEPGGGWKTCLYENGVITEDDLMGPLAGEPLTALIDAMASGDAYVNVHTDDGENGDDTGMGDYISGEIRGQIRLFGTLPEPPEPTTARLQVIHNAADPAAAAVDVYINDAKALDDFAFRAATPYLDVPANVELVIGVAPGTSTGPGDIIATFPVTLTAGETYVAIANGVLDPSGFAANPDGRDIAFTLFTKAGAREAAMDPSMVDFFALHGVTDVPMVDVYVFFGKLVVDDAKYGDMTGYESLEPKRNKALVLANYSGFGDWDFTYVGLYEIDLTGLDGGAAVVFASGFLSPADNQSGEAFGLFAALPNGTVVEFPRLHCTRSEALSMMADETEPDKPETPEIADFGLEQNLPNPFNPVTTIAFTLPSTQHVSLKVYDVSGREVATIVNGTRPAGRHKVSFEATNIASGIYFYRLRAGEFIATKKMIVVR